MLLCTAIVHRTVTELFVRDIYVCKFLDFKSIHEHEKYIDIYMPLLQFTNVIMLVAFSSVLSVLLSTHSVDCSSFIVRSPR